MSFQPFQGTYRGRIYPQAYTQEEQTFLKKYLSHEEQSFELHLKSSFGKLCKAGYAYARVNPDGYAFRCAPAVLEGQKEFGFFFHRHFKLLENPLPCRCHSCLCGNEWTLLVDYQTSTKEIR